MTLTYEELHRRTRERDRSLREKVTSLEEAAALVPDGASVGIGGSTLSRTPVAMIWGRQDNVTPLWQSQALLTLIPGSRLRMIDGAGHIPYIENTAQFNEVLLEILRDGANKKQA